MLPIRSLSDFQTGIDAVAYTTLDTEHVIFHTRVSEVYEFLRFMTLQTVLCPNRLIIQFIFKHIFLILLPGNVMMPGLHSIPSFTTLMIVFLLVRLAFIVTSTGLWQRLTNTRHLDCSGLQPL